MQSRVQTEKPFLLNSMAVPGATLLGYPMRRQWLVSTGPLPVVCIDSHSCTPPAGFCVPLLGVSTLGCCPPIPHTEEGPSPDTPAPVDLESQTGPC